ncbi:MAG: hypothetical protein WAZ98_11370 [Cyclobacteriaceae bacterium]
MEQHQGRGEKRKFVIEKIKRISVAMDRGEFWTMVIVIGLFIGLIAGLVYFFVC